MATQPSNAQPDFDRLYSILVTSGLQQSNPALYQVIESLIRAIRNFQGLTNVSVASVTTVASSIQSADLVTWSDESVILPNSREVIAGSGIEIQETPNNRIVIHSAVPMSLDGEQGEMGDIGPPGIQGIQGPIGPMGPPGIDAHLESEEQMQFFIGNSIHNGNSTFGEFKQVI